MSTFNKEQLIEDLKTSSQNSSGMFEIGEGTICELMDLLTAPPAPVSVRDEREVFNAWNNDTDCPLAGRDAKTAAWLAWCRRAAMLQGAEPVTTAYKLLDEFDFERFNDVVWLEAVASNPHMHSLTTSTIAMVALELNKRLEAGNSPVIPDGWVACSERMPEEGGRYWCYVEEQNDLGKSHYQWNCAWNGNRWWVEHGDGGRVTHWMPLPAAPQQEA